MYPEEVNKLLNALGKKEWNIVSELYSTHKEYIRNCIEDKEKRKGLGLVNSRILELILVIGDIDYIKSIIENKDKIENLNLSKWGIKELIKATKDPKYIKRIIEDKNLRKELKLDNNNIIQLILAIGEPEYIKSILDNKEKLDEFELDGFYIAELIEAIGDLEYIKNMLENKGIRDLLPKRCIARLITLTDDPEFIKSIIGSKENRIKFRLDGDYISKLIVATNDIDYIKSILKDKEKIHELDLTTGELITLIESIGKKEHFSILAKTLEQGKMEFDYRQKIKLPANMTIGIEIESEGENSFFINHLSNIIADGWICKSDETLKDGAEVVSPILTGDTEKTTHQIKYVCQRLNRLRTNCNQKMWRTYSCWC